MKLRNLSNSASMHIFMIYIEQYECPIVNDQLNAKVVNLSNVATL